MSLARANAGVLRRLAAGPEASRCTAALQATSQSLHALHAPSPSPLQPTTASRSPASSPPFSVQASRFHTSAPRPARRRRFASVNATSMGLVDDKAVSDFSKKHFPQYTEAEKELLREKYTPAQLASIEASEAAIDPEDLTIQGRFPRRTMEFGVDYFDDFTKLQPIVDRAPRDPEAAAKVPLKFEVMPNEIFKKEFDTWLLSDPEEGESGKDGKKGKKGETEDDMALERNAYKYMVDHPAFVHADGITPLQPEELGNSSMAPALPYDDPSQDDAALREANLVDPYNEGLDETGEYARLVRLTGLKVSELKDLAVRVVDTRTVFNQTRLGKTMAYAVIAIAGNANGRLGIGEFKSSEFSIAASRAREAAILNMKPIPRYEDRTIYGNVEAKVSGTVVQLFSRPPGFGLRVPHRIFEMARVAGIQDLAAKMPRSRNPMNSVKATYQALMKQRDPEQIAVGRGKKLVDVRKVYYGGAVY